MPGRPDIEVYATTTGLIAIKQEAGLGEQEDAVVLVMPSDVARLTQALQKIAAEIDQQG